MRCLNCGCDFHRRPTQQYFCSTMCWEEATKNTPWRILSGGLASLPERAVEPMQPGDRDCNSPAPHAHYVHPVARPRADELAARLAEIPDDDRDLTGRICGDPIFERSALAKRAAKESDTA